MLGDERFCLFVLGHIFFDSPKIVWDLIRAAGSARGVFNCDKRSLRNILGGQDSLWERFNKFEDFDGQQKLLDDLPSRGVLPVIYGDSVYPKLLTEISDPPTYIMIKGEDLSLFGEPMVAIVGSRKASEFGRRLAFEMSAELSSQGICTVSGMAYGIDTAVHKGALSAMGNTIAVLGAGVDVIYPMGNRALYKEICLQGLVISEFPLGTYPLARNFPQRNRVISGLSIATVVIEAAENSGSLITARFALESNRDVLACPGPAGAPMHKGSNDLLRNGAHLVECADDVLAVIEHGLNIAGGLKKSGHLKVDMGMHAKIMGVLNEVSTAGADELAIRTGLRVSELLPTLSKMVLDGSINELPGGQYLNPTLVGFKDR